MDLIEYISQYGPWSWVVAGLVLLAIELVAPGGVFIWLGGAAVVTGLITLVTPLDLAVQWAVFGVLSLIGLAGWVTIRRRVPVETDSPHLNKRAARHRGKEGFLSEPIAGGTGRMELGDSVWRVKGPELPTGHRVRIVGNEGTTLIVVSAEKERTGTA